MSESISPDLLAGHRRMRACLHGIRHLDPVGVDERLAEFDREIARLETLLGDAVPTEAPRLRIEFVPIGRVADERLRAA